MSKKCLNCYIEKNNLSYIEYKKDCYYDICQECYKTLNTKAEIDYPEQDIKFCIDCNNFILLTDFPSMSGRVCKKCTNSRKKNSRNEQKKTIVKPPPVVITSKICDTCSQDKPLDTYNITKTGKITGDCKSCNQTKNRIRDNIKIGNLSADILETEYWKSNCICCHQKKYNDQFHLRKDTYFTLVCNDCYNLHTSETKQICFVCGKVQHVSNFHRRRLENYNCNNCSSEKVTKKVKVIITEKHCVHCNTTKSIDQFKPGAKCKDCCRQIQSARRKAMTKAKYSSTKKKKCNECKEEKLLKEFPTFCNTCQKCKAKSSYEMSDKRQTSKKQWFKDNRPRVNKKKLALYHNKDKYNPLFRFKERQRSRIRFVLKKKHKKTKTTDYYLDCSPIELYEWISYNIKHYNLLYFTFENYGKLWNLDHVIPLDLFDTTNDSDNKLAFNWKNVMPMTRIENSGKRNTIIISQIEKHYKTLIKFHKEKNIELPKEFHNLYAKYLVDPETPKDSTTTL